MFLEIYLEDHSAPILKSTILTFMEVQFYAKIERFLSQKLEKLLWEIGQF